MEEFIDNGLRVRSIGGSIRDFIREDGIKITKKNNGQLSYYKGSKHRSGYIVISIGGGKSDMAHRVVAKAFLPNPTDLPIVDHIDNNSHNNNVLNLRWVTNKQNAVYYHTEQSAGTKNAPSIEKELLAKLNAATTKISNLMDLVTTKDTYIAELKAIIVDISLGNPVSTSAVPLIGNTIVVDGKIFGGTGSAAAYITEMEKLSGSDRNKGTINKELRRFIKGERPSWVMYEKYTIG